MLVLVFRVGVRGGGAKIVLEKVFLFLLWRARFKTKTKVVNT